MTVNSSLFFILQKLILRFQMQVAALLLHHHYLNKMEFNALDSEEFSDDYYFASQEIYKQET